MTREQIKTIAYQMVETDGLINLSRAGLCQRANIPDGSFQHIMGCTFSEFTRELVDSASCSPACPVSKTRTDPSLRRGHILNAALNLSKTVGYNGITREMVAEAAGVSGGLVSQYFSMPTLRAAVLARAVECEVLEVIAQGLISRDLSRLHVSAEIVRRALETI